MFLTNNQVGFPKFLLLSRISILHQNNYCLALLFLTDYSNNGSTVCIATIPKIIFSNYLLKSPNWFNSSINCLGNFELSLSPFSVGCLSNLVDMFCSTIIYCEDFLCTNFKSKVDFCCFLKLFLISEFYLQQSINSDSYFHCCLKVINVYDSNFHLKMKF